VRDVRRGTWSTWKSCPEQSAVPRRCQSLSVSQIVIFDAPTDGNGNVGGDCNFDGQAQLVGRIPRRLGIRYLTTGRENPRLVGWDDWGRRSLWIAKWFYQEAAAHLLAAATRLLAELADHVRGLGDDPACAVRRPTWRELCRASR
jgi:hypothetical protein